MFHAIEKYKLPAQILLGLIALTFVGFGASTLATPGHDYVGKVGDIKVSEQDVNEALRRMQASGNALGRDAVYQGLLQQAYLQQGGHDLGVNASLEQIKHVIAADPGFQENGRFSEAKYQAFLQQSQMSEAMLIEDLRRQFAIQSVVNLMQGGTLVSDAQARQMLNSLQAVRQVRTTVFAPAAYADKVKVDDAAVQAYYDAHKAQYEQQQAVKFEFVALKAQDLGAKATVSDEELQQAYAQLPADASAAKPALATVKAQLEAEIRLRKGRQALAAAREELADLAFNHPDELKTAATKLGLKIESPDEWISAEAAQASGMPPALQAALFSDDVLVKKHNSEPVAMSNDEVWVVRAKEVRAKQLPPLNEVKAQVQQDYVAAESLKLALAAAETAKTAAAKGEAVALNWSPLTELSTQQAQAGMPAADFQQLLKAHPQADKPAYVLLAGTQSGPVLIEVQSVSAPKNVDAALPQAKQMLAEHTATTLMASYLHQLQQRYPVKQGAQQLGNNAN